MDEKTWFQWNAVGLGQSLTRAVAVEGNIRKIVDRLSSQAAAPTGIAEKVRDGLARLAGRGPERITRELLEGHPEVWPPQVTELIDGIESARAELPPSLRPQLTRDLERLAELVDKIVDETIEEIVPRTGAETDRAPGLSGSASLPADGAERAPSQGRPGVGKPIQRLTDGRSALLTRIDRAAARFVPPPADGSHVPAASGLLTSLVDPAPPTEHAPIAVGQPPHPELPSGGGAARPAPDKPGDAATEPTAPAPTAAPADPATATKQVARAPAAGPAITPWELARIDPDRQTGVLPRPSAVDREPVPSVPEPSLGIAADQPKAPTPINNLTPLGDGSR